MATEIYDINDIKRNEEPQLGCFWKILVLIFTQDGAQVIFNFLMDVWCFFAKLFHYFTLPFMFFYFFFKARKERKEKEERMQEK